MESLVREYIRKNGNGTEEDIRKYICRRLDIGEGSVIPELKKILDILLHGGEICLIDSKYQKTHT